MAPRKSSEIMLIMLLALLLISQIYFGPMASVAVEEEGHTHVIFQDDFEDGEAGDWGIYIPDEAPLGSNCRVEIDDDGNYVLSSRGQTWTDVGDTMWTNYTFEVKFKFITPQGCAMINFRMYVPSIRYFLQFFVEDFFLTKNYLDTYSDVKQTRLVIRTNTWYTLKIVCVGNNIKVYVDDVLKLQYTDNENPLLTGKIGLETCRDSHIHYDDVKVCTTHRLYVTHLIKEAQDEIDEARRVDADTSEAEQRLAEAQAAFAEGDLSSAESLARETINLAEHAPVGPVSVNELSKYSAEYDQRTVEVSGTIKDIEYVQGIYKIAVEDGTGVISATFNGTLGEIKTEDKVKVVGTFDASTGAVMAERLEVVKPPTERLYTFLVFKDDFEDGDFSDWGTDVDPKIEGSGWKVEKEDDNHVLSCVGSSWGWAGDLEWTDYTFELKMKLVKGGCAINFRMTPKPEYAENYGLGFSRYGLSFIKTELYLKEVRTTELKHVSIDLNPDRWYDIKIICIENNIKAYLDDNLKIDYTDEDSPFLTGAIELGVYPHDGDKPSHAFFDDIKVSEIATTSDINDLITYAQSEIDKAKEINADVSGAELKLEQAEQALAQEDYQIVQYLVDETVWLAKRASVGQISIKDVRALATKYDGHVVMITGTVKDLQARYGVGYDFTIDDGTGGLGVTYQGALVDIGEKYEVKVTGLFDAPSETVTASRVEKISGPQTQQPSVSIGPIGITWSIEEVAMLISIGGTAVGVVGWLVRHHGMEKKRKILFKKLMDEVDDVYSRFKMNALRCETELHKLKDEVMDEFKEGMIDEDNYITLDNRIEDYMKEIREQIEREKP